MIRRIKPEDVSSILDKCREALNRAKNDLQEIQNEIVLKEDTLSARDRIILLCKYAMYHSKYQFYRKAVSVLTDMVITTDRPISSFQQMADVSEMVEVSAALRDITISKVIDRDERYKSKRHHHKRHPGRKQGKRKNGSDSDSNDFDFE